MKQPRALVCGAGGFIGAHLVADLRQRGYYVVGADMYAPKFASTQAHKFVLGDLRNVDFCYDVVEGVDEVYQLAANMGGAGFIFTGDNDADIMTDNALININIAEAMKAHDVRRVFYSSSACIYPEDIQTDPKNADLRETNAYPANPDSDYGWEKIFSERMWLAYARNHGFDVRIARLHNVYGPLSAWTGGREKSPAALCRKVAEAEVNGVVEVWGPGNQTRSFLYIDQCLEGIRRMMDSEHSGPFNLGSERMISMNGLVELISQLVDKPVTINNIDGPLGVMGRTSNNNLLRAKLDWAPEENLEYGIKQTYDWICEQMQK